jgi:hypothetical protein
VFILGEKQRGLGPIFHSGKIFKENQGAQMNRGKQRTIYKPKGEKLKIWPVTRIKTRQDYILGYINTHLWPLKTLCDNIWLHRGWHAPYELPRTRNSSALAIGLWSLAQNFRKKKQGNMYTILLKNENKHMGSRRILFIYNPRLIDVLQGAR